MPYNEAIVHESVRHFMGRTFGVPHRALRDTNLAGYCIPELTKPLSQFVVGNLGRIGGVDPYCLRHSQEKGKLYRIFELLYNKCAAYNLRYCPLRKPVDQDKYLLNAFKDLTILTCFLIANLVVFVIILTRTVLHIFAVFKATGHGIRKYLTTVTSESSTSVSIAHTGTLAKHDFRPPSG